MTQHTSNFFTPALHTVEKQTHNLQNPSSQTYRSTIAPMINHIPSPTHLPSTMRRIFGHPTLEKIPKNLKHQINSNTFKRGTNIKVRIPLSAPSDKLTGRGTTVYGTKLLSLWYYGLWVPAPRDAVRSRKNVEYSLREVPLVPIASGSINNLLHGRRRTDCTIVIVHIGHSGLVPALHTGVFPL